MKKNFLKSLSVGVASLTLIASCSMLSGKDSHKCASNKCSSHKCSSKADGKHKCSSKKESHSCSSNKCASKKQCHSCLKTRSQFQLIKLELACALLTHHISLKTLKKSKNRLVGLKSTAKIIIQQIILLFIALQKLEKISPSHYTQLEIRWDQLQDQTQII